MLPPDSSFVTEHAPFIVALGGTLRPNSSTEKALRIALSGAAQRGAQTLLITGPELELPIYAPDRPERTALAVYLVESLRRADGIIIGSPCYHGSISGMIKNALDYVEDMRGDADPYFHARPVGVVATAAGWQGAVNTLTALRNVVHALRGWNTPMGVPINTVAPVFDQEGACLDSRIAESLEMMGAEVAIGARVRAVAQGGWRRRATGAEGAA